DRIEPVVRWARILRALAADEGAVLHARHVARMRARQVRVGPALLGEPGEGAGRDQLGAEPVVFLFRTVAPDNPLGLGQAGDFGYPLTQPAVANPSGGTRLVGGSGGGCIHA